MPPARYYRLTVKAIREETADARSFTLAPEHGESGLFRYRPGQFLSFRIPHESGAIVRSYSLSSAPGFDPDMTVCVKRVENGLGSNWFNDQLLVGARVEAQVPAGRFTLRDTDAPLLLLAGGSGITPCISLIKHALAETSRAVKLVYANQNEQAIIYRNILELLAARYTGRFTCRHWLDDESGFMSPADVIAAANRWDNADIYICGPAPLMDMAETTLAAHCGESTRILTERFLSPDDDLSDVTTTNRQPFPAGVAVEQFRITLDGVEHATTLAAGQTLLEAALAAGIDAPHSCTEGHCGACMAQLREGRVEMANAKALSKRNVENGFVLACQSRPTSTSPLWLDFDL